MEIESMLVGAALGLGGAVIGAWVNHLFLIRADRIKRRRDQEEKEAAMLRERLMPSSEELGRILGDIADPSRRMKEMAKPQLTDEEQKLKEFFGPTARVLFEIDSIVSSAITTIAVRTCPRSTNHFLLAIF